MTNTDALEVVRLMAAGGFKRREQALNAVASGAVDMVGIARAMVLDPVLAKAWYTMRMTALGEDSDDSFTLDLQSALRIYEERDAQRCSK